MASTSSGVLTRRARRSSGSPSMSSADGNAFGSKLAAERRHGVGGDRRHRGGAFDPLQHLQEVLAR